MTPDEPHETSAPLDGGQGLKNALRRVFDGQIPNYGDYNLVVGAQAAPGTDRDAGSRPASIGTASGRAFVLGYRWKPMELMIAPVDLTAITGAGVPVEVNMTNLAHAVQWDDGVYEVGTSTGRIFRFGVAAAPVLDIGPGSPLRLAQEEDQTDFTAFMDSFIAMA
ncbi:hypothetical protein PTW37_09885 [Arthrobacter agilis]|uniref:hypothetical protein n=1 Tax=Arthrobacter agilis TaxID=37921 RepID=UPI00236706D9|nr:hypothetical protein [Arthrobacter agilis]WDF32189.1 hypothetical protein PTW37_09885 [Arthrobacter agilis]